MTVNTGEFSDIYVCVYVYIYIYREREYNKVQARFVLETSFHIFALRGFVKACVVGLTDSYPFSADAVVSNKNLKLVVSRERCFLF